MVSLHFNINIVTFTQYSIHSDGTPLQAMHVDTLSLENINFKPLNELVTQSATVHHNLLSILTIIALIMTLTTKRFVRAIDSNAEPPKALLGNLNQAMKLAQEKGLVLPASLQTRALKYVKTQ